MLIIIAAFILAIGILVTIHELGHYAMARFFGVRVLRFSIGFGKTVWLKQFSPGGTEWALALVPLGGFVRMLDERDPESLNAPNVDLAQAFNRKPVWQRMLIVLAGPVMNLLLAIFLYAGVLAIGAVEPAARLGQPAVDSPVARHGLQFGDRLVSLNGSPIHGWNELNWQVLRAMLDNRQAVFTVERLEHGRAVLKTATISATDPGWPGISTSAVGQLGLVPYEKSVVVRQVMAGSAGEKAGLQENDTIVLVDGRPALSSSDFTRQVRLSPGRAMRIEVIRAGAPLTLNVVPAAVKPAPELAPQGKIGVALGGDIALQTTRGGIVDALRYGLRHTWEVSVFSLRAFGKMVIGELPLKMLSGPVTIADAAGQSAKVGFVAYLAFLAMVSVSLGVLNLLPVPVLDGGHLMYYLAESVRGKPLPSQWFEWGQRVGFALIAVMTALALYNDIERLLL
ncbi:MAG: RIP metalloprotease RseP [Burkholderiaceae bacterium]